MGMHRQTLPARSNSLKSDTGAAVYTSMKNDDAGKTMRVRYVDPATGEVLIPKAAPVPMFEAA